MIWILINDIMKVTLRSAEVGSGMRDLSSDYVSKLVKIPGIIVAATGIKAKATSITIQCRSCRNTIPNLSKFSIILKTKVAAF